MTTIYFATNRNLIGSAPNPRDFGDTFARVDPQYLSPDRREAPVEPIVDPGYLRFGQVEVSGGKLLRDSIRVLPDKPNEGSKALLAQLRAQMREDSLDSLVFIHGFNVSFSGAIESAAQLSDGLAQLSGNSYQPNIFVFSWPSNGKLLDYRDDRYDAKASGYAFARGLKKLSDFLREPDRGQRCDRKIHLIAHSMGNYVLRNALQEAQETRGNSLLPCLFENIVLTAADEDSDAFEHDRKLARLLELSRRITIYFNTEDRALEISDLTKGNPERLGEVGPRNPLQLPAKVIPVDVSEVVRGFTEHSYHIDDDNVVQDLIAVLKGVSPDSIPARMPIPRANTFKLVAS